MDEQYTRIDFAKNRIYLYFEGFIEKEKALIIQQAYQNAIDQVKPGFTVVTFAENMKPGTPEVQDLLQAMAEYADRKGCRKVGRVVGITPLGGMQINRLAKIRCSYPSRHFATQAEAEVYLDSNEDA